MLVVRSLAHFTRHTGTFNAIARVCPKGRFREAYKLKGSVWRVNCAKLRATSTDLHRGARDSHGRTQPSVVSMVAAQPLRAASVEGMCG